MISHRLLFLQIKQVMVCTPTEVRGSHIL